MRDNREIIVPFPVESALSGICQPISPEEKIWYKRTFFIPEGWSGRFIKLHFGAVDWETTVFINGHKTGMHRGGYDPFSFDISSYLDETGVQEIVVSVWDPTDKYHQPRGKQKIDPKGIWYTPVSGIWQTVWIEPVNFSFIESFKCTPDIDQSVIYVNANIHNPVQGDAIRASVSFNGLKVAEGIFDHDLTGKVFIPKAKLYQTFMICILI